MIKIIKKIAGVRLLIKIADNKQVALKKATCCFILTCQNNRVSSEKQEPYVRIINIMVGTVMPETNVSGDSVQYAYERDHLVSVGDEACTYEVIGNPTTYRGKIVTWANGRQMSKFNTTEFAYD